MLWSVRQPRPRLRRLSGNETIRALERLGFVQVRQRGSHVVPLHRELAIGTLRGILKQAGVTPAEFMEAL